MTPEATALVRAFVEADNKGQLEQASILVVDDGFDAAAIRVLAAWAHTDHRWVTPARPCPDGGRPTPRSYKWLMDGVKVDYDALADAAGVTRSVARQKVAMLLGARLVYPDGKVATAGKLAMQAAIAERAPKSRAPADKGAGDKKGEQPKMPAPKGQPN